MKTILLRALLLCAVLLLCMGAALADEQFSAETQADLFTAGGTPEIRAAQTYTAMELGEYIADQLGQQAAEIDVTAYGFTTDGESVSALVAVYSDVINSHPELFYVGSRLGYSWNESGTVVSITPEYLYEGEDLQNRIAAFEGTVSSIASYASRAATTVGKLAAVNDYFCVNFQYDTSYTVYRPDLLFSGGKGVCQAYMLAYSAVLNELGIANTYATSDAMNHTWNLVQVDGSWYHVDVTWNDPTPNVPLRAGHDNFLLSDSGIAAADHYSWSSSVSASSTKYDSFFWVNQSSPLGIWGDKIYYGDVEASNGERTVHCWSASSGSTQDVLTYNVVFFDGSYYPTNGYYSTGIAADAEYIYYGALGSLYAYPVAGGTPQAFYHTGADTKQIVSCFMQGNTIRMLALDHAAGTTELHSTSAYVEPGALVSEPAFAELWPGETLTVTVSDENGAQITAAEWDFDDQAIEMGEYGVFTALRPGCYVIKAWLDGWEPAETVVVIHSEDRFVLPSETKTVETEAFVNTAVEEVVLPEGVEVIGDGAFSNCSALVLVQIPDSVTEISPNAFDGINKYIMTILCGEGSTAHLYAQETGMEFQLLP